MDSSDSELSWPATTSHETSTFCCFPRRRGKHGNTSPNFEAATKKNNNKSPGAKRDDNGEFITLFNPDIPMTPNIARMDSCYVVDGFFFDSVRGAAYVGVRDGKSVVPCKAELNESFVPSGNRKRLMYLGFRYPDGTSLSFVPVRDVILQHRSTIMSGASSFEKGKRRLSAMYGRDYVYLSIPRVVYYVLVQMAEEVFNKRNIDMKSVLPEAEVRGERVWLFNTEMKESCKVEGCSNGRRYAKTVIQAMKEMGGNLEGDALLFMRFCDDVENSDAEMKLEFRLHRMMVKGVSRY